MIQRIAGLSLLAAIALSVIGTPGVSRGQKDTGKTDLVREIDLKGLKLGPAPENGDVKKRTDITSAVKLAEVFTDKDTQDKIAKQVDFAKEYLVLFRWSGSGQDKLTATVEKAGTPTVIFDYTRGKTKDLRPHAKLFVVNKKTGYSILGAK